MVLAPEQTSVREHLKQRKHFFIDFLNALIAVMPDVTLLDLGFSSAGDSRCICSVVGVYFYPPGPHVLVYI